MQIGKRKDAENSDGKRNNPSLQNALVGVESGQKVVESRSHVVRITLRDALLALHRRDHDHTVVHGVQSVSKENISIREDTAQNPRHLLPGEDGVVFHPAVFIDIRFGIDQLRTGVGKADVILSCRKPLLFITEHRKWHYYRLVEKKNAVLDVGNAIRFHPEEVHIVQFDSLVTIVYAVFAHLHAQNGLAHNRQNCARIDLGLQALEERAVRDQNSYLAVLHC